ncbi:DUF1203 domain-containing protein [Streptacidiphilus sp. N1-10]|uniref:DUF1203 domain-containing protein n=1 Tax=Streptacidiphilus jeojiensis TaxID=3229225 RepID=A0ABV6XV17_9ACTN
MTTATTLSTDYTVHAIAPDVLAELRVADDLGRAMRPFADDAGGSPLRCCLRYSNPGEPIALVSYGPLHRWAAATPGADPGAYDERGPIFIHADPDDCEGPEPGGRYPLHMHDRRVFRAYDAAGHILRGELVEAVPEGDPDAALHALFADPEVALVHVRALGHGCFVLEARRSAATSG